MKKRLKKKLVKKSIEKMCNLSKFAMRYAEFKADIYSKFRPGTRVVTGSSELIRFLDRNEIVMNKHDLVLGLSRGASIIKINVPDLKISSDTVNDLIKKISGKLSN